MKHLVDMPTVIEHLVAEHYWETTGEVMFLAVGNWAPYDIVSQSRSFSVEVKFDMYAQTSKNLAIEFQGYGKPSGMALTAATRWVQVVPIDWVRLLALEFDTETLRNRVSELPLINGGDQKLSRVKLLPITEAEKIRTDRYFLTIDWKLLQHKWKNAPG